MAPENVTAPATPPAGRAGSLPAAVLAALFAVVLLLSGLIVLFGGGGPVVIDVAIAVGLLSVGAGSGLIALGTFSARSEPAGIDYARRLVWIGRWVIFCGVLAAIVLGVLGDLATSTPGREPLWPSPVFTACFCGVVGLGLGWLTARRMR